MMIHRTFGARLLACALLLTPLAGCDDPSGSRIVDEDELIFIRQAETAPALEFTEISFWAKRGQNAEVRMPYVNGYDCLRFKVPGNALDRYPDGTQFQNGDSVRITIRVAQTGYYNFDFQPSGLRFDPEHPAELRVSYDYRDDDTDGDGDVDAVDEMEFEDAGFWKQETPGGQWMEIGTVRFDAEDEFRAELNGFTRYALASN
jgi:hypothetical protein